jgi:hypothetical protein
MRFILTALLLVLGATEARAGRNAIEGLVVDRNGEPIVQAIVSLAPGNVQLVTDRDGRFFIDYLRDDEGNRERLLRKTDYTVEVFKTGYHTRDIAIRYTRGPVAIDPIALTEDTITVEDHGENLDPGIHGKTTQNVGATYEGQ